MKILFVASQFGVYNHRFLSSMVAAGLEVVHAAYYAPNPAMEEKFVKAIEALPGLGQRYYRPTPGAGPVRAGLGYYRHLRRVIREERPDILHGCWATSDGFWSALTGFHPFLFMAWGSDVLVAPHKNRWNRWKVRWTIRQSDLATCDSEYQKQAVVEIGGIAPDRVITFPWGIDLDRFRPGDDGGLRQAAGWDDGQVVLVMNRLFREVYGHRYFIAAFAALAARHPQLRLFLLSDGELRPEILAELDARGLRDRYRYGGNVPPEEMVRYLNASDIYVSTSLSDGASCSLLEAMACALPVVVSDVPATAEWVVPGENGMIAERRNPAAIAAELEPLIRDQELRRRFGARNLAIARDRADWQKNFAILMGIYQRLDRFRRRP